ncbi:TetR family transcriptional regulator [Williamsia sp. Leaf354]|uniref:TetR/AcrR family transcriptional regulator n=1 Tax=Williamsia herbipolensis TaxID=1603258 RepID=A0AAU4K6F5_9NOCA|nr:MULTISPECIES: TetR/AcrR family transcriptional regulator [Williamsia]KQR96110.1 TetR family transcriptional regulator [Williamsia sp. Leaf354]MCX6467974.1 helix-turn-helix domain containing protein [Mycobacteriales bacterium]
MSSDVSASGRKTRNTDSPGDQEDAILSAAAAEFTETGVRRASVDEIAKRAGVSRSTLYRRFPNKESLLLAVATRLYQDGMHALELSITGLSPKEAIAEAFSVGAQLIQKDPLMHRLVIEDADMKGITSSSVTSMFIDAVTDRTVRALRSVGATRPDPDLRDAVEIVVRLVISQLEVPASDPMKQEPEWVRAFAATHLAPMIW